MDTTKLRRLAESLPDVRIRHLDHSEATGLKTAVVRTFGLDDSDDSTLMVALERRLKNVRGPRAHEADFDFGATVVSLGIRPLDSIYINWHRFDDIDAVPFLAIAQKFDDFWYPAADDIDIFDDTLAWLISIDHEGFVRVATASTS